METYPGTLAVPIGLVLAALCLFSCGSDPEDAAVGAGAARSASVLREAGVGHVATLRHAQSTP